MTRHRLVKVRGRWDFTFPLLRYRGAEHICACGATFPSDDGIRRHVSLHKWDDPTEGDNQ